MKALSLLLFIPFASKPVPWRVLSWSDFKGQPNKEALARTQSGIVIENNVATAIFIPDESWTRTNDSATLSHEQLHFDITQLWASKITVANGRFVDYYLEQWGMMESRYDKETEHGNNTAQQARWEREIKRQL